MSAQKAGKTAESRFAKIEGKKLQYLTAGEGPAVILLHGYTQTSRMWRPLIEKLKDKFTVIAPDLPGIGDKRRRLLIERFGSVSGVKQASEQDLVNVLGRKVGKTLYQELHA